MSNIEIQLSVIIPIFGNEKHVRRLYDQLVDSINTIVDIGEWEVVFVDDGSPDKAWDVIRNLSVKNPHIKAIKLSRNFGQHNAITAGLDYCLGQWAVVLDADGQDPPEAIPMLWNEARKGYDVVNARRIERGDSRARVYLSKAYHIFFQWLSGFNYNKDVANYRLISRKVINSLLGMRESFRGFPMHVHWLGFKSTTIDVPHPPRWSGGSAYSLRKLLCLAIDVAIAYSNKPLKLSVYLGSGISVIAVVATLSLILRALLFNIPVPGWASLIISVWFFSGIILANLGILGIYMARILTETRSRPLYVVDTTLNI